MGNNTPTEDVSTKVVAWLELGIFETRWLLAPIYIGLVIAEVVYCYLFVVSLWDMIVHVPELTSHQEEGLIRLLGLVDYAMVANLVMMIVLGSWHLFIQQFSPRLHNRPQWLHHVDSSTLKIKMGKSLIGVSSINLLKQFLEAQTTDWNTLSKLIVIHLLFVVSTMAIAWMASIHSSTPGNGHESAPNGNGHDGHETPTTAPKGDTHDTHGTNERTAATPVVAAHAQPAPSAIAAVDTHGVVANAHNAIPDGENHAGGPSAAAQPQRPDIA
jgi:uncharacterized protein (TIGR00645 family)